MTQVHIAGVGESAVGEVPDIDPLTLGAIACREAVADAGLEMSDVDGVLTVDSIAEPFRMHSIVLSEYLGISPNVSMTGSLGGASHVAMVLEARDAILSGRARAVLVTSSDKLRTGMTRDAALTALVQGAGHPDLEKPYAPLLVSLYGMVARRHMHEYGTTPEQLATVAVVHRAHAALNPAAQLREPVTVEEVLSSRLISDPLHRLECSLVSDGAGAVLVTAADVGDGPRAARILGGAEHHTHEHIVESPNLVSTGARVAAAGVAPSDVDVALIYDSFTITVILLLEELGFCEPGAGGRFVADAGIGLDGQLPVNPHGGLLGHCHPGRPGGIFHIVEAVRQLRGEAAGRQVVDAALAMVHGCGGVLSTHASLVLSGE